LFLQKAKARFSCLQRKIETGDDGMKKNTLNFWTDILIFIDFIALIFTGVLLRNIPAALSGTTIVGIARNEWVDLHWVLALSLILFIFIHLALHWNWARASSKKHLSVGPKTLAISVALIVIFFGIVLPGYLTKDFQKTKETSYEVKNEAKIVLND
jgi:hypothetical protein